MRFRINAIERALKTYGSFVNHYSLEWSAGSGRLLQSRITQFGTRVIDDLDHQSFDDSVVQDVVVSLLLEAKVLMTLGSPVSKWTPVNYLTSITFGSECFTSGRPANFAPALELIPYIYNIETLA